MICTVELPQAFGWLNRHSDKITLAKGNQMNSLWPAGSQVLVLNKDDRIHQIMTLFEQDYLLQLQYSISINLIPSDYNFTAEFRIYWNGVQIFHFNPTSSAIQKVKTRIGSKNGTNTLEFVGDWKQDCDDVKILIDNVKLFQIVQETQKQREVYTLLSRTGTWTSTEVWVNQGDGHIHNTPYLDYFQPGEVGCWSPRSKAGSWIQIFRNQPTLFVGFQTQARNDQYAKAYVKSYKVQYTVNGVMWQFVQNGRIFPGNFDFTTRVRVNFAQPILATSLRFIPMQFTNGYIALRIDSIYLRQ